MYRFAFFLVCCVFVAVRAEDSDVLELDTETFQDGIADKDIILVEFYAPWCGHCKRLAPEYEIAATALAKEDPPIFLAKVDCPANTAVCSQFGVSGYPTLKIFRDGSLSGDYQGPRNADGIVSYMKKQGGPSSKVISTVEAMKAFINSEEQSIIGFFAEEESKLEKAFMSAASSLRDSFRFAHTVAADIMTEFGLTDQVAIFQPSKLHTKLEDPHTVYDGKHLSNSLKEYIKTNFMGLAGLRTRDNMELFDAKKPLVVVYFAVDYTLNPKGSNYYRNRVIKVAKDFIGDVTFAISSKDELGMELEALGKDSKAEIAAGLYDAKGRKYAMEESFSVDNLRNFVQQFLADELEPYLKSEPIPEDNDGPVTIVVGKNFEEIVNDETKDALVEFYAPWCGHCKSLAPKYDELGEKLKDDPNIVIAKGDATANDYPSLYEVKGFPTIYWVPAGNKSKPEKYQGGREVDDFLKFIKENATNPPVITGEKSEKSKKDKEEL